MSRHGTTQLSSSVQQCCAGSCRVVSWRLATYKGRSGYASPWLKKKIAAYSQESTRPPHSVHVGQPLSAQHGPLCLARQNIKSINQVIAAIKKLFHIKNNYSHCIAAQVCKKQIGNERKLFYSSYIENNFQSVHKKESFLPFNILFHLTKYFVLFQQLFLKRVIVQIFCLLLEFA